MTRMTRPDCAVMCNLINTHTHAHTHTQTHTWYCTKSITPDSSCGIISIVVVIASKISKIEFLAPGFFGQDKFAGGGEVSR